MTVGNEDLTRLGLEVRGVLGEGPWEETMEEGGSQ